MRPVFFLHIPKTAGTSIHQHLARLTGGFHFLQFSAELSAGLPAVLARHPSTGGHLRLAEVIDDLDPMVVAFTILRDPVDRFLSLYYFLREPQQSDLDPMVKLARSCTLEELARSTDPLVEFMANQQCHYLSLLHPSASPADHCASALQHLGTFNVVGRFDDLDGAMRQVGRLCGARIVPDLPHLNKTLSREARPPLDADTLAGIEHLVRHDRQLWAASARPASAHPPGRLLPYAAMRRSPRAATGTREATIDEVLVHHTGPLCTGCQFLIEVVWHRDLPTDAIVVGLALRDFTHRLVYGTSTEMLGATASVPGPEKQRTLFSLEANFSPGVYSIDVALLASASGSSKTYHSCTGITSLELANRPGLFHHGYADLKACLADLVGPPILPMFEPGTLRAWLGPVPASVTVGEQLTLEVQLFNGTPVTLATLGDYPIHLSYHWKSSDDGRTLVFEGARSKLLPGQPPRSVGRWPLQVLAPSEPGRYRLQFCLVQEGARWIIAPELSMDSEPLVEVSVSRPSSLTP